MKLSSPGISRFPGAPVALIPIVLVCLLLPAAPAEAQFNFGLTVAVVGDEVLVGEPGNRIAPGFVYVYRANAGSWQEVQRLVRSEATNGDAFGQGLVADGDRLLIGAAPDGQGTVYVFERQDTGWIQVGRFAGHDGDPHESFGTAIAMSGDVALVGAAGSGDDHGAAYLYVPQSGGWRQIQALMPDAVVTDASDQEVAEDADADVEAKARFGAAVAIDGDWAMVGAPAESGTGSVYVFRREAEGWQFFDKLASAEARPEGGFGSTVVLRNGWALVGAVGAGAVHVFFLDDEDGGWIADSVLQPFDGQPRAGFGAAIAVGHGEVLVGAPGADDDGRIYRFSYDDDFWTGATKMGTASVGFRAAFASALAVGGDVLVAGVPEDDLGAGSAVIMERSLGGWDRTRVLSEALAFDPVVGGAVECVGGMAGRFPCDNFDLISFLPNHTMGGKRGSWANDVWGWKDPGTDREYALVGLSGRTSFVDVTDPHNPIYVGNLPKTAGSPDSYWRDIKVHADHAFIVADAAEEHGVQIFDLARLREYDGKPIVFSADTRYDRIDSAHNIVINEESAFAYVVGASGGGETCGGGLHMINIEDPKQPIFAGCFSDVGTGRASTGYSHDAQCVIYEGPDEQYVGREICFGSNETAVSIADVTNKRNPVAVSLATYPNVGYTHQGWLTDDHRFLFMNDELDEAAGTVDGTRTLIFDVQELDDPILVDEYIHDTDAIDHNLYIVGDRMYQSNYNAGLRVLDISDPEHPVMAGYFDTVPWDENEAEYSSFSWSNYPFFDGGFVLVTSIREGLFIVKER